MKLPILELQRISQINNNKKCLFKLSRKKSSANYFFIPKNNISSIFSEKKLKWEEIPKESHRSHRYMNIHNNSKSKLIEFYKAKNEFLNNNINKNKNNLNYLSSYNCKSSNKITYNDMENSTEEESAKNNNYEKYIKKTLNSFKIKKEISSFLYSSPDKQKQLIDFLSDKFNKINRKYANININNNGKNIKNNQLIKIRKKLIKIKGNERKDLDESMNQKDEEYDEDKTNLKEFSLFSLFIGKKKEKMQNKIKFTRGGENKYIECWDNNLLKNILPKNIKSHSELNLKSSESNNRYDDNSFGSKHGDSFYQLDGKKPLKMKSGNNMFVNKYKYQYIYDFEQNKNNKIFRKNYYHYSTKRLTRSSSNL